MRLLGSHSTLLHPRRAKERKNFISSSLTSSAELSKRLLNSSGGDRSRPLAMSFHEQWQHLECAVFRWYTLQTQSSTRFITIQHWKTKKSPFFHEYILIPLDDGAICRIERMGEGSRKAAITRLGCKAHDIIQWFAPSKYDTDPISQEPAEMICQVDFPRTFDLLDVLAICWSVQRTQRCSAYTLQRYNCYFLCLTILAVLSRRVGAWESAIDTDDTWSVRVDQVISYLGQTPCKEPDEYLGLGICKLLDPNHLNPRSFILDTIRGVISAKGLNRWRKATSDTLWMKDLEFAITQGMADHVEDAVKASLDSADVMAAKMKLTLESRVAADDLRSHDIPPDFLKAFSHEVTRSLWECLKNTFESAKTIYRMHELEYKSSLSLRMIASAVAPLVWVVVTAKGFKGLANQGEEATIFHKNLHQLLRRHPFVISSISKTAMLGEFDKNLPTSCGFESIFKEGISSAIPTVLHQCMQSPACNTQASKLHALMILHGLKSWRTSLQRCVGRAVSNSSKSHIQEMRSNVQAYSIRMIGSEGETQQLSNEQFQDHIFKRIQIHAQRVGSAQLAAGQLVESGIKIAMSEVWNRLPAGYGGLLGVENADSISD